MKSLDLNACGVEEMNENQMKEIEGGNPIIFVILGLIAYGVALFVNDVTD